MSKTPVIIGFTLVALVWVASASAQAWAPPQGEVRLVIGYEYFSGGDNLFNNDSLSGLRLGTDVVDGRRVFVGDVLSHTLSLSADVGVFSWLAVSTRAAMVSAVYQGVSPGNVFIDDGSYHTDLQDWQISLRSPLRHFGLQITPGVGLSLPLSGYTDRGQSAIGLGSTELQTSLSMGLRDWGWRRSFYAQTSWTRRWLLGSRSDQPQFLNGSAEVGFFPTAKWAVSTSLQQQFAWAGLEWLATSGQSVHGDPSQAQGQSQRSNVRYSRWSIGVDRFWSESMTTSISYTNTLWGENTTDSTAFIFSVGWGFRAPWAPERFWY